VALASILLGIGGMANYLVPLMIGAEDMAFPRLNAFAYWINVPGAVTLMLACCRRLGFGLDGLPAAEPARPVGYQWSVLGRLCHRPLVDPGSLNLIATILLMRPKGMTLFRMPIFCWAVLATSMIQLTATQFIGIGFLMMSFERSLGMPFFNPIIRCGGRQHRRPADSPSSTSSGSTRTRRSTSLCCPAWASSASCCRSSPASRSSATAGWRFPAWRLPWSASWSGATTCSPPATSPTCAWPS
jgi:hypothetical protein